MLKSFNLYYKKTKPELMTYTIKSHGVACFSIHFKNTIIVFDPHKGTSMNLSPPKVRNADLVLISHKHYDHNDGKELVSNQKTAVYEELEGTFEFNKINIVGVKVKHGGDRKWGDNIIYVVKIPTGEVIIHTGDIGKIPTPDVVKQLLSLGNPDIIILPIGGKYCLNAKEAIQTAQILKPNVATIVCHYLYGPLLIKEDFQGMTDEQPFLELVGENISYINGDFESNMANLKQYLIFEEYKI